MAYGELQRRRCASGNADDGRTVEAYCIEQALVRVGLSRG
jgi:hypothetical protein